MCIMFVVNELYHLGRLYIYIYMGLWERIHQSMQETQEMWVRPLASEDPLEEEVVTHSSILAWKIPWTEEPGGPQSMGRRDVHNFSD